MAIVVKSERFGPSLNIVRSPSLRLLRGERDARRRGGPSDDDNSSRTHKTVSAYLRASCSPLTEHAQVHRERKRQVRRAVPSYSFNQTAADIYLYNLKSTRVGDMETSYPRLSVLTRETRNSQTRFLRKPKNGAVIGKATFSAYADDIVIFGEFTTGSYRQSPCKLTKSSENMGLRINEENTKFMVLSGRNVDQSNI